MVPEQISITGDTTDGEKRSETQTEQGLACSRLLLGKYVHRGRIQDVVNHPNSSEESSDTVTDLRSYVLAQQLRCMRVNRGHVSIELVSKSSQEP